MELSYIGVVHPDIGIKKFEFLFYDKLFFVCDGLQISQENEPLVESGIIELLPLSIELNNEVISLGLRSQYEKLSSYLSMYEGKLSRFGEVSPPIIEHGDSWKRARFAQRAEFIEARNSYKLKLGTPVTMGHAEILNNLDMTKAIPILPTFEHHYAKFVRGYSMDILKIPIPVLPMCDLIKFKYDQQDKLRILRSAFARLYSEDSDIEYAVEEISLAVKKYAKAVQSTHKKYELERMSLKVNYVQAWIDFFKTFNINVFSNQIKLEQSMVNERLEIEGFTNEGTYLYECANLRNQT
jgi:hypothetical protein